MVCSCPLMVLHIKPSAVNIVSQMLCHLYLIWVYSFPITTYVILRSLANGFLTNINIFTSVVCRLKSWFGPLVDKSPRLYSSAAIHLVPHLGGNTKACLPSFKMCIHVFNFLREFYRMILNLPHLVNT